MVSTPRRCNAMSTSLPSSPAPSSITRVAVGDRGVPRLGSLGAAMRGGRAEMNHPLPASGAPFEGATPATRRSRICDVMLGGAWFARRGWRLEAMETEAKAGMLPLAASRSSRQGRQVQRMGLAQPDRAISVVAQFVVGVWMDEDVQGSVVQCEPAHHMRKAISGECQLVAPHRVGPHRLLVKASHLYPAGQLDLDGLAQGPGCLPAGCV